MEKKNVVLIQMKHLGQKKTNFVVSCIWEELIRYRYFGLYSSSYRQWVWLGELRTRPFYFSKPWKFYFILFYFIFFFWVIPTSNCNLEICLYITYYSIIFYPTTTTIDFAIAISKINKDQIIEAISGEIWLEV